MGAGALTTTERGVRYCASTHHRVPLRRSNTGALCGPCQLAEDREAARSSVQAFTDLTVREAVLEALANVDATATELALRIDADNSTVRKQLTLLVDEGKVTRYGERGGGIPSGGARAGYIYHRVPE